MQAVAGDVGRQRLAGNDKLLPSLNAAFELRPDVLLRVGAYRAMSRPDIDLTDEEAGDFDRRFHLTIARLSSNPVVEYFIQQIWRMRSDLPRVAEVYARVCHDDGASRADEHMAIFEALRSRDPVAARNAMRYHFQRLFEAMLEATESQALEEIRRRTQQDRERFLATTRI